MSGWALICRLSRRDIRGQSWAAAELGAVTVQVIDRRGVIPGNLLEVHTQRCRKSFSLLWTGRVTSANNGLDHALLEPRGRHDLTLCELALLHPLSKGL